MELGYRLVGNGPVRVVVLHEWASASELWEGVHGILDGHRFTYAFVELRGYGQSRHLSGTYSSAEAAADVVDTASMLGWATFHAIGHSMSGMVVQRIVLDHPGRLSSVVAIAPVPASGMAIDDGFKEVLRTVPTDPSKARHLSGLVTGNRLPEAWYAWKGRLLTERLAREAMLGYLDMWTGEDFSGELPVTDVPALAVVGTHDVEFYREANLREVFGRFFSDFTLITLADAAHYPMCETPLILVKILEDFLISQSPNTSATS
ncbi:MAG: alpha/beta fold hydrolase [Hyphomicrobiaceae bacterium]